MRHIYTTPREKRTDLWFGFVGWIVVNTALLSAAAQLGEGPGLVLAALVVLANIATPIVLALTRRYVAIGIALAFAVTVALTAAEAVFAVIGLFVTAFTGGLETNYCSSYQTICIGPPAVTVTLIVGCAIFCLPAFFVLRAIHHAIR